MIGIPYCKYCGCLLSIFESTKLKDICKQCLKFKTDGLRFFGSFYGWLTKREVEQLGYLRWEDGKE